MNDLIAKLAAWISQGTHVILFPRTGHHNMTISARCFIESARSERWGAARKTIDAFFRLFGQRDHCFDSFMRDVEYAEQILGEYRQRPALRKLAAPRASP